MPSVYRDYIRNKAKRRKKPVVTTPRRLDVAGAAIGAIRPLLHATEERCLGYVGGLSERVDRLCIDVRGRPTQDDRYAQRERIATAMMAGFASNSDVGLEGKELAPIAVKWADALIAELDK